MAAGDVKAGLPAGEADVGGEGYAGLDAVRLKEILPQEIWLVVAAKLQKRSKETVEYLAKSSEFFGNLLASQRTTQLFEKVFPLVAASVWKKEGLEGLPVSDVLKCRGVSKHWNTVIDKLIPEKLQHFGEDSNDKQFADIGNAFKSIVNNNEFIDVPLDHDHDADEDNERAVVNQSIQRFLSHFELTHPAFELESIGRNPWIWGNLSVDMSRGNDEDIQDFLAANTIVLLKYGGHLRTLSVLTHEFQYPWIFMHVVSFSQWLEQMPNLKKLNYKCQRTWRIFVLGRTQLNLDEAVRDNPIPKLEFLESMHLENLPLPMFNQLVGQNNHVSELVLNDDIENGYDILAFDFPNLKTFGMKDNKGDLVQKLGSPQVNWRLESLKLGFRTSVNGAELFKVMEKKFSKTLVSLSLEVDVVWYRDPKGQFWQDCKTCRLDLPMLRKFRMDMDKNPVCLDFLLPMRHSLEEIAVSFGYEFPFRRRTVQTSGTIVQYYGFEEKMMESNLWAIFKKLNKFEVMGSRDLDRESKCYLRENMMPDYVYA